MSVVAPRNRPAAREPYRLNRELLAVGVALDDAGIDDVVRDHLTRRWNELFAELAMTPAPRIGRKVKARWLVAHAQRAGGGTISTLHGVTFLTGRICDFSNGERQNL
jgi:hypothetical protein